MHAQLTQALISENVNKLTSLKKALKSHVESYFDLTQNTLLTLGSSQTTIDALRKFDEAFTHDRENEAISINDEKLRSVIQEYLDQISYDLPETNTQRKFEQYLPATKIGQVLQESFIINNPFDNSQRFKLNDIDTDLFYNQVHKQYHSHFLTELQKYKFYDLFLINHEGSILYTVFKEFDFATNLINGPYADSGLASAYRQAMQLPQGEVVFIDFYPYEPSYNKPAAFIATPLFNGNERIGVIAVQLPIAQLTQIMTLNNSHEASGLGKSGEAYLVGDDHYMRSDSRFIANMTHRLVEKYATSVGIIRIETVATKQALKGVTGDGLILNYREIEVYSSYAPLEVYDKTWGILVEIDRQEVLSDIRSSTITLVSLSSSIFIVFLSMIMFLFIKMILHPMRKNEDLLTENLRLQNKALLTSETILNEYKKVVDLSAIVSKANIYGVITYVNEEFCKISGYQEYELLGRPHNTIRHPDMPKTLFKDLWNTILNKKVWKGVIKNRKKDGGFYYVSSTIVPMLDENREIQEFMSIRTDITDLVLKEEQILKQTTDAVTGLPNRQKLMEDINDLDKKAFLATILVHNLRDINDFYGTDTAQKAAQDITAKIQHLIFGQSMKLYRISGDEFAIMTEDDMPMNDFEKIIHSIFEFFDHTVLAIEDNRLNISITVGMTNGDKHRLFVNSEMALRKAIENSRSLLSFESDPVIEAQYQNNTAMTTKIKNAIKHDNILVFAQAISPNKKGHPQKYECLVRMRDEDKIISPFFFLEVAKKARLYSTITKIVIEKAIHYFSDKEAEFSINLTLEDIQNDEVVSLLKSKILQYKIGHRLVIELVESEGIEEYESVMEFISTMKSMGCKIAIDDFGTGYSNFEYFTRLNVDYIKIDGSLIKNIHLDTCAEMVVDLIVQFAKRMNIHVIAEFVHDENVQGKVTVLDIDYSQGYFIEEPQELKT